MLMIEQVFQVMAPSGDVCVPKELVWAVAAAIATLGGANAVQWRAGQLKGRRVEEALAQSQDRLFNVLTDTRHDKGKRVS